MGFNSAFKGLTWCVNREKLWGPGQCRWHSDSLRDGRSGDRISLRSSFCPPFLTGPGDHPASYTMRTGSFPGEKQPGRGVDHPNYIAPRLKKE